MSAHDRTEDVLKSIHVLFSKAEPYENSKFKVIIDKTKMMDLLKDLNSCIYDIMDEYEMTSQSRDKAERKRQRAEDERVFEARKEAEDIYAGALMYSDRALSEIQEIIAEAGKEMEALQEEYKEKIREKKQQVRTNQLELKGQLTDLIDTQKYMRLIEDENARIAKEKESGEITSGSDSPSYEKVVPEIKVNEDYFRQTGQLEGISESESDMELAAEEAAKLDEEYFAWKDEEAPQEDEAEEPVKEKKGFLSFGKRA